MQQPLERIVIDTSLPTIVPPPSLAEDSISDEQPSQGQAYASINPQTTVTAAEKKKSKTKKKQVNHPASASPAIVVASNSPATIAPPTRLSFASIISGQLVRDLFNLR
jgi:hypothetical protein